MIVEFFSFFKEAVQVQPKSLKVIPEKEKSQTKSAKIVKKKDPGNYPISQIKLIF